MKLGKKRLGKLLFEIMQAAGLGDPDHSLINQKIVAGDTFNWELDDVTFGEYVLLYTVNQPDSCTLWPVPIFGGGTNIGINNTGAMNPIYVTAYVWKYTYP